MTDPDPVSSTDQPPPPAAALGASVRALANLSGRPCLAIAGTIDRGALPTVQRSLEDFTGEEIDLLVASPGGDIEAAYLLVRTLRRRARVVSAFVPYSAKSAATLLCLGADEIVFGELGELGPLDAQNGSGSSALVPFSAVEQMADALSLTLRRTREAVGELGSTDPDDAAEIAATALRTLFDSIDPLIIAQAARVLDEAREFAVRIFRRYRPDLGDAGESIAQRLIHAYPCHGFPIDLEEVRELGLPARAANGAEAGPLDAAAAAIREGGDELRMIILASPDATPVRRRRPAAKNGAADEAAA